MDSGKNENLKVIAYNRDKDPAFFPLDPDQLRKKPDPDPTLIRDEEITIFIF